MLIFEQSYRVFFHWSVCPKMTQSARPYGNSELFGWDLLCELTLKSFSRADQSIKDPVLSTIFGTTITPIQLLYLAGPPLHENFDTLHNSFCGLWVICKGDFLLEHLLIQVVRPKYELFTSKFKTTFDH